MLDYERFERRQLAQDRDNRHVQTVDVAESQAQTILQALRDADIVVAVPEDGLKPSSERFGSNTALVHFHWGWEATTEE